MAKKNTYVRRVTDLLVYQMARKHAMEIFRFSKQFPVEERWSLTNQIRKSSRSVNANLSEAWAKRIYKAALVSKLNDAEGEEYVANIQIKEPDAIQISTLSKSGVSELNRKDGKASIEITGGTAPYKVLWSNGRTSLSNSNLPAGKNTIKVIDQNNCVVTGSIVIDQPKVIADLDRKKLSIGQTLQINQLFFTADSSVINPESYAVLDEIYEFLSKNNDVVVEIGGHTNGIPPHEYCDRLSTARAKNVACLLYTSPSPRDGLLSRMPSSA